MTLAAAAADRECPAGRAGRRPTPAGGVPRRGETRCPCCGSALPAGDGIRVDLESNTLFVGARADQLTPTQAEVLHVLIAHAPRLVRHERLILRVWGIDPPDGVNNVGKVYISRLRRILDAHGYAIENVWGEGYRLVRRTS